MISESIHDKRSCLWYSRMRYEVFFLLGSRDPCGWNHYTALIRREPNTQWHSVTYPEKWYPNLKNIHRTYGRINSTTSPALGTGNNSEVRLVTSWESAQSRVRVDQCVSAVRRVEMSLFICLPSSYIPTYIQQGATLHRLFISGNCSTC